MGRRYVLKNKRRFAAFIMLLALFIVFTGLIVDAGAASKDNTVKQIVRVESGDTLWEIASDHAGQSDIRKYIFDIKQLNNLENDQIYTGQILLLP